MITRQKPRIEISLNVDKRHIELLNEYQIDSTIRSTACIPYLENLHKTLCDQSNTTKGISKATFLKYADLPGVIGERVFDIADKNRDGFLSLSEFISPIMKLNSNDKNIKIRLIFDIYDFDDDNLISQEDIKKVMLHTISQNKKDSQNDIERQIMFPLQAAPKYFDFIRSFEQTKQENNEIDNLCALIFFTKTQINFEEFKNGCENISSEMFLSVYTYPDIYSTQK